MRPVNTKVRVRVLLKPDHFVRFPVQLHRLWSGPRESSFGHTMSSKIARCHKERKIPWALTITKSIPIWISCKLRLMRNVFMANQTQRIQEFLKLFCKTSVQWHFSFLSLGFYFRFQLATLTPGFPGGGICMNSLICPVFIHNNHVKAKKQITAFTFRFISGLPTGMTALSVAIFWDNYGIGNMWVAWTLLIFHGRIFIPYPHFSVPL